MPILLAMLWFGAADADHETDDASDHMTDDKNGNAAQTDTSATLRALNKLLGGFEQAAFLPVDEAFGLDIAQIGGRLQARFEIADGYYLYREKIRFTADDAKLSATLPAGESKTDPYFGKQQVFYNNFTAPIAVARAESNDGDLRIHATYQGCAEGGICYAPVARVFEVAWGAPIPNVNASANVSVGKISLRLLASAFIGGVLLTFTPCVLPMLPILGGVIAAQGARISRRKAGGLAGAYIAGTIATYSGIGAVAGASGAQLQAYFQTATAIGGFAALLAVMALAMFGAITIQMPAAVQSFWHRTSGGLRDSHFAIFALGAGSALIVGACVSPVLISFLGLAVSGGDVALGAALMAAVAAGMGMPLLAVALGGGHYLPRAGRWMTAVKHGIGILLLGTAIYLLGALPAVPVLMLWAVYLACIAIYLWHKAGIIQHRTRTIVKTASIGLCVWAAAAMVGGIGGGRDLFAPVAWHGQPELASTFMRVASLRELDARLADAAAENKLAVLDYYADWCVDCVRMENTTLRDARVRELLAAEFIALQVDVSNPRDKNSAALKSRYGVYGPPAVLFFDRNGRPIRDAHFYGYIDAARFYTLIAGLANETQQ